MLRLTLLFFLFISSGLVHAKSADPVPNWELTAQHLRKAGFKPKFIQELKASYDPHDFKQVLELNTLLFLKKSDYHGVQVTDEAATDVHEFVVANRAALSLAEKRYGVSGDVIASLLWMESRHGKNLGAFHVPSVYLTLLQADRPDVIRYLQRAGHRFTTHVTAKNRQDIASRAHKRVTWALAELKAIHEMHKRNKNVLKDFNGSFAGAFGMPQFIPSSYVSYARAENKSDIPDLEDAGDAIQSVGFYLQKNGWKRARSKTHVQALMKYNNSHDYAAAILKLSKQAVALSDASRRTPSSR